ncbi:MAG: hypothetical protein O2820_15570 [Planctomycetota bacterium]|nr:hypothetical protein [Planctomycetota bacterium]MDA1250635.1 hypothetical protein [Planctomycetota bacterium]
MSSNALCQSDLQPIEPAYARPRANWRRWFFAGFATLVLLLSSGSGLAQDEPATGDGPAEAKAGEASSLERLIYLPYRNLKDVFAKHGSTVFMPYAEYLKLWEQSQAPGRKDVEGVITEAHYTASVDKSLLRIKAELTVRVLGKPWVEVPVTFGRAAVGKLTADKDGQVLLRGTGDGQYALLFGEAGEHKVTLELAAAITTSPDGRSADFSVPPVGVTTFELAIPETDQTVEISPQLVGLPIAAAAGETRIKANLGSTTSVSARWHPRTSMKPDMDLLASVKNLQKVSLRDGLVHTDAWLEYDVLRGEMTELAIAVPLGQRILGVTSPNSKLRGWKKADEANRQTVTVEFLSPVKDKVTIEVHTEREFAADAIEVAGREDGGKYLGIHSVDAVRESGQITVAAANDLSLQFEQTTGLSRIEDDKVEAQIREAGAASFKFYSPNIRLSILAKPVEPRLQVNSNYAFEFSDDELQLMSTLNYTIERAGIFELSLNLPDGLEVDSVGDPTNSIVREHHVEGDSPRVLRVVLHRKTAADSTIQIQIKAHTSFEEVLKSVELSLPIPEPIGIERETAQVQLVAEGALEVITDQDAVVGAQPMPLAAGSTVQGKRVAAAWTFNRRPVEIPIRTLRRPTRLTASIGTTATVKEEIVEVKTQLTYNVQYAGIDTFRFAVPESLAKDPQITSLESGSAPAIKQKVKAEEAENGWVTWTVTMQRDVIGRQRFQVTWDLKPKAAEGEAAAKAAAASTSTTIETLRVLGLTENDADTAVELSDVLGEIVVQKDRALSVTATKLDDGLEVIDVRELSLLPQAGALAYRYYVQNPVGIKVDATKHEIQKVVETVVMRSLVEVVARRELTAAYRCRYWLQSSERQRLQIDIPAGSNLLGVFVDGKQLNPEKNTVPVEEEGWDSYFINVARTNNSDQPFGLTIQMVTPISDKRVPFDSWLSGLVLRLPQIGGLGQSGVASQETQTVVWVPEDYRLLGNPDNFVNRSRLDLETAISLGDPRGGHNPHWSPGTGTDWVGIGEAGFIDFPTEGTPFVFTNLGGAKSITVTWASMPRYTWLLSGALVLIAILLRRIPWDHKLLILVVLAFVTTLAGLSFPGWIPAVVAAMKYGLYALAGIWILQAVFSWRGSISFSGGDRETPSGPSLPISSGSHPPAVIPPPGVFDDFRKRVGK